MTYRFLGFLADLPGACRRALGALGLGFSIASAIASTASAATVTLSPAPGTIRISVDTLDVLTDGGAVWHGEGNDYLMPSPSFRVESAQSGTWSASIASWTVDGAAVQSLGGSSPLHSRLSLSRAQVRALGPGPHAVRAVVQFPDTTVTAEWSFTLHALSVSDARVRAQVVRANKGSNTLPDTLGYRVLTADSIDGTVFAHWPVPPALNLSGDTLRAAEVRGGVALAKGTLVDLFALRVRYAVDRDFFVLRPRNQIVDSTYDPGFTLSQALAAIASNFGASPRLGPVMLSAWTTTSASAKTENGWKIIADSGYGDCPSGCTANLRNTYQASASPQGLKICRNSAPSDHPSLAVTTCKINGVVVGISDRAPGARSRIAPRPPVRADGRRLPVASPHGSQLRAPSPAR